MPWICIVHYKPLIVAACPSFIGAWGISVSKSHLFKCRTWQFVSFIHAVGAVVILTWALTEHGVCLSKKLRNLLSLHGFTRVSIFFFFTERELGRILKACLGGKTGWIGWENTKGTHICTRYKVMVFRPFPWTWVWVHRVRGKIRMCRNHFHEGLH